MQGQFDNNKYNTKAILGFIFSFVCWPAGLVLSILGRNEIKRNGGKGKGLTTASFVLCGISVVAAIVAIVMVLQVCLTIAKIIPLRTTRSIPTARIVRTTVRLVQTMFTQFLRTKTVRSLDQVYERNN